MEKYGSDASTVYECYVGDEKYCFRYPNPTSRNGGKSFSGVAVAWLKSEPDKTFTVPFYVKGEDISQSHSKIIEGIQEQCKGD